jgi:predicted amino acid dehydrogenase
MLPCSVDIRCLYENISLIEEREGSSQKTLSMRFIKRRVYELFHFHNEVIREELGLIALSEIVRNPDYNRKCTSVEWTIKRFKTLNKTD